MSIRHPREWFKVTDGGAPLNCDDAILALERERIVEEEKKLEKVKKDGVTRINEINGTKTMMEKKGRTYNSKAKIDLKKPKHLPNWTLTDLRTNIKRKAPK